MRVVVTRPREDAEELAAELRRRGHEPVIAPLLEIELIGSHDVNRRGWTEGVQALALTSANAARAAGVFDLPRALPVYTVGDATAEAARRAGFLRVESAKGDARALAALIRRRLSPSGGAILHLCGNVVAGRLCDDLEAAGFRIRRIVGYRSRPVERLPEPLARLLQEDDAQTTLKAIMIFSPRTAETFVTLVNRANVADRCTCLEAACLSPAVAERLYGLALHGVRTAPTPDRAGMLAALDAAVAETSCGKGQAK